MVVALVGSICKSKEDWCEARKSMVAVVVVQIVVGVMVSRLRLRPQPPNIRYLTTRDTVKSA